MYRPNTILASALLAAAIASPAAALDLSVDAALGAAPEDMTTMKAIEDSAFVGNEVRTKDQVVIGLVESVYEGSDGNPMAVITLKSDVASQSSVKSFTVTLAQDMTADGSLTLGWTESELFTALSANLTTSDDKKSTDDKSDGDNSGG